MWLDLQFAFSTTRDPAVQALQFLESLDSKDTNQKAQYFRFPSWKMWIYIFKFVGELVVSVSISFSVLHFWHRNSLLEVFPIIPKVEQNSVCFNILHITSINHTNYYPQVWINNASKGSTKINWLFLRIFPK